VARQLASGGRVRLQLYESYSGAVRRLSFTPALLQQLASTVDGDGSMSIRVDGAKNTVSVFLGMASRDYRLLHRYAQAFALGEVQVRSNSDLCYLEVRGRARVATLMLLLQNQLLHPVSLEQQQQHLGKLGYSAKL
jgi:hypothetical protein